MMPQSSRDTLQSLLNCEGALASILMTFKGELLGRVDNEPLVDMNSLGVELAKTLAQVRQTADLLKLDRLEEAMIHQETLIVCIRVVDEQRFLGLALSPMGNPGRARFLLNSAAFDLRSNR
jgi:predicted regulator of Ras-like GTPase activity (Roadblock/LC7/MglB family)